MRAPSAVYVSRKRRLETLLRLDAPPVILRNEAQLLVKACCGNSRRKTVLWVAGKYLSDWSGDLRIRLKMIAWKLRGKDPRAKLDREAEDLFV